MQQIDYTDDKLKEVSNQILQDGKEASWPQVHQGLREFAFMCAKRGLTEVDFLNLRKDMIETIETFQPMAKTYIELEEKNVKIQ